MIVKELIEKLQEMPQDVNVILETEDANIVILENCNGNEYVRICGGIDIGEIVSR